MFSDLSEAIHPVLRQCLSRVELSARICKQTWSLKMIPSAIYPWLRTVLWTSVSIFRMQRTVAEVETFWNVRSTDCYLVNAATKREVLRLSRRYRWMFHLLAISVSDVRSASRDISRLGQCKNYRRTLVTGWDCLFQGSTISGFVYRAQCYSHYWKRFWNSHLEMSLSTLGDRLWIGSTSDRKFPFFPAESRICFRLPFGGQGTNSQQAASC